MNCRASTKNSIHYFISYQKQIKFQLGHWYSQCEKKNKKTFDTQLSSEAEKLLAQHRIRMIDWVEKQKQNKEGR